MNIKLLLVAFIAHVVAGSEAPILDIDNQSAGYVGKISEHSVLVDLTPHLQIKNINSINGICSYHVFKPNTENFPFTVEIKDKLTGEAMIELVRKDLSTTTKSAASSSAILLDCSVRKSYDFLIQAHDCSSPSLYSNKVPVRLDVIDSDDYLLKFEEARYRARLVKSRSGYQNFMVVKARDNDCSNNGFACAYSLEHELYLKEEFPFVISNEGQLSTDLKFELQSRSYQFKVRAHDCVNPDSFVTAEINIEILEPCQPEWTDYPRAITANTKSTPLFDQISTNVCPSPTIPVSDNSDSACRPDSVTAHINLILSPAIMDSCVKSADCSLPKEKLENSIAERESRTVIFSGSNDDDDIEDMSWDENSIESRKAVDLQEPLNYRSFSKRIENAVRSRFDGVFGDEFILSAWIRRPANADPSIKEQVVCGSDSLAMNRHHFGLYFYRNSIKFLMRKESSKDLKHDQFYPSLWEWSLPATLLTDTKWHFYEVKLTYPTAQLFVDGIHFAENKTNSDIVDAYELADSGSSGPVSSYVGACYHARTNSLVDHFEGDIGSVVVTRHGSSKGLDCKVSCRESININMVGNEVYLKNIEHVGGSEIRVRASSLEEMGVILRKVNYVNEEGGMVEIVGDRVVKVETGVHCGNSGKQIVLGVVSVGVEVSAKERREFNVHLEGDGVQVVGRSELENGIEPFRDVGILGYEINKVDDTRDVSVMISECRIKITPERNVMTPMQNYEKIMFLQNLLDEFHFEFKETLDSVLIRGVAKSADYQSFIRRLTYVITNVDKIDERRFIKEKQFFVSCVRSEPSIETNTVVIQLKIEDRKKKSVPDRFGFVAHKQAQKLVVNEDNNVFLDNINMPHAYDIKTAQTSPLLVFLVALCVFGTGFFVVMGVIRLSSVFSTRKLVPGEENLNMEGMEWDDNGLNITENPLDKLEVKKEGLVVDEFESDEEYTSNGEDDEGEEEYDARYDENYCSGEEQNVGGGGGRNVLEWDDTNVPVVATPSNNNFV